MLLPLGNILALLPSVCTTSISVLRLVLPCARFRISPATTSVVPATSRHLTSSGTYVEGLTSIAVSSWDEMSQLLTYGGSERTVAATNANDWSSRSHAVFTLTLRQVCKTPACASVQSIATLSLDTSNVSDQETWMSFASLHAPPSGDISLLPTRLSSVFLHLPDIGGVVTDWVLL